MLKQQSSLLWTRGCSSKNVREAYSGSLFSFFIVASSLNLLPRKVLRTTCVHQTVQRGLAAQRQKSLTREIRLWDFRKPVVQGHGLRLHAYIYIYIHIFIYICLSICLFSLFTCIVIFNYMCFIQTKGESHFIINNCDPLVRTLVPLFQSQTKPKGP